MQTIQTFPFETGLPMELPVWNQVLALSIDAEGSMGITLSFQNASNTQTYTFQSVEDSIEDEYAYLGKAIAQSSNEHDRFIFYKIGL